MALRASSRGASAIACKQRSRMILRMHTARVGSRLGSPPLLPRAAVRDRPVLATLFASGPVEGEVCSDPCAGSCIGLQAGAGAITPALARSSSGWRLGRHARSGTQQERRARGPPRPPGLLESFLMSSRFFVSATSANRSAFAISRAICRASHRRQRRQRRQRRLRARGAREISASRGSSLRLRALPARRATCLDAGAGAGVPRSPLPAFCFCRTASGASAGPRARRAQPASLTCQPREIPGDKGNRHPPLDITFGNGSVSRRGAVARGCRIFVVAEASCRGGNEGRRQRALHDQLCDS